MKSSHPIAARGYARGAQTYARGRPGFPPQALDWLRRDLGLGPGKTAVEVGAGTGKFTQLLAQTGAHVIAVEPVPEMLAKLSTDLPSVRPLRANADAMPLPAAVADVVICAQSFHWFATAAALAEFRRVLKPGGRLGLIWNVRDASIDWVAALEKIVDRHEGDAPRYYNDEWRSVFPAPGFGPLQEHAAPYVHRGSAEQVIIDRVASVSFIAALPDQERHAVLEEVRTLIADTPELAGESEVCMPYVTKMYWCRIDV